MLFQTPPARDEAADAIAELVQEAEADSHRRDRLLSGLVLLTGIGVLLGAPFALKAGAAVFMPVVAAVVIGLILIPLMEWLERRRLPSALAALIAVIAFLVVANAILVAIVLPAIDWFALLPTRMDQVRANLAPIVDGWTMTERLLRRMFGLRSEMQSAMETLPALVTDFIEGAPLALFQVLFTLLLAFFMLTGYVEVRDSIMQGAGWASGSLRLARLVREIVRNTAAYIFTVCLVNFSLGAAVAGMAWAFGLPTPVMWGGFAALFNFVPYAGPLLTGLLLLLGGLVAFDTLFAALLPAAAFLGMHMIEANIITPALIGRRLTINPLLILIGLSFWGWVWGAVGALLSVPILIMAKVFAQHVGTPDIMGFLFRDGTLVRDPPDPHEGRREAA